MLKPRRADEICADDYRTALFDTELNEGVRSRMDEELTGDETSDEVRDLAREIIDSELN